MPTSDPSFLSLTNTAEIRGALGVDTTDIDDTAICNLSPQDDLESDLLGWVPTYKLLITEGLASSPTDAQKLKYLKLQIYAKYFISALVASSGINSILQKRSDGSNEGARFTNITLKELTEYLEDKAAGIKSELELLIDSTISASYEQFGTAPPSYDPVTNV